jgi:hypothetical protein
VSSNHLLCETVKPHKRRYFLKTGSKGQALIISLLEPVALPTRVNIRISERDLERLKQKAAYKGLPYQTFIASILHEYAAGHFEREQ